MRSAVSPAMVDTDQGERGPCRSPVSWPPVTVWSQPAHPGAAVAGRRHDHEGTRAPRPAESERGPVGDRLSDLDDLRLRLHERARPTAAPLRKGDPPAVDRERPARLVPPRRTHQPPP